MLSLLFKFLFISLFFFSFIHSEDPTKYKINLDAPYNPESLITSFSPEMLLYYSKFIGISYCQDKEISKGICCDEEITSKKWRRLSDSTLTRRYISILTKRLGDVYNFQILVSEAYKKILFLFPGNREIFSQIINEVRLINLMKTKVKDGLQIMQYVGEIYKYTSKTFYNEIKRILSLDDAYSTYQPIFLGHSLGGMVASVYAFDVVEKKIFNKEKNQPVLITLGSPKVGNDVFVNTVKQNVPHIFRVKREGDIFPKIPCKQKENLDLKQIDTIQLLMSLVGNFTLENKNYDDFDEFYLLDKSMNYLYHCNEKTMSFKSICQNRLDKESDIEFDSHFYYFFKDKKISNLCISEPKPDETLGQTQGGRNKKERIPNKGEKFEL